MGMIECSSARFAPRELKDGVRLGRNLVSGWVALDGRHVYFGGSVHAESATEEERRRNLRVTTISILHIGDSKGN